MAVTIYPGWSPGQVLNVDHGWADPRTPVKLFTRETPMPASQAWEFHDWGNDRGFWYGELRSGVGGGGDVFVLAVHNRDGEDPQAGDTTCLMPRATHEKDLLQQLWVYEKRTDGGIFYHRETGLVLDHARGAGDKVIIWDYHGRGNQEWWMW